MAPVEPPAAASVAEIVRRSRTVAVLSQAELAERAGLSVEAISAIERGTRRHLRPYTMRQLSEALALSAEDRMRLLAAAIADRATLSGFGSCPAGANHGPMNSARKPVGQLMELSDLLTPWAVRTAATLRLADHIAAGTGEVRALAAAAGVDADGLGRLLRFLCARGLFTEPEPGRFALTEVGEALRDDHPAGMRGWLDPAGCMARTDLAFARLLDSVRSGEPSYHLLFGRSFWEDLDAEPDYRRSFDALMARRLGAQAEQVAAAYDWSGLGHVVDVGGGTGLQLRAILGRAPALRGTLVDMPGTAAEAAERLCEAGLAGRAEVVGASFFDELPAGADAYLLSDILHNWSDADSVRILRRCADAVVPDGRVLIVEDVAGDRHEPMRTVTDLRMLVTLGGRERGLDDIRELAGRSGLRLTDVIATESSSSIVECRPAGRG